MLREHLDIYHYRLAAAGVELSKDAYVFSQRPLGRQIHGIQTGKPSTVPLSCILRCHALMTTLAGIRERQSRSLWKLLHTHFSGSGVGSEGLTSVRCRERGCGGCGSLCGGFIGCLQPVRSSRQTRMSPLALRGFYGSLRQSLMERCVHMSTLDDRLDTLQVHRARKAPIRAWL